MHRFCIQELSFLYIHYLYVRKETIGIDHLPNGESLIQLQAMNERVEAHRTLTAFVYRIQLDALLVRITGFPKHD